ACISCTKHVRVFKLLPAAKWRLFRFWVPTDRPNGYVLRNTTDGTAERAGYFGGGTAAGLRPVVPPVRDMLCGRRKKAHFASVRRYVEHSSGHSPPEAITWEIAAIGSTGPARRSDNPDWNGPGWAAVPLLRVDAISPCTVWRPRTGRVRGKGIEQPAEKAQEFFPS
ncbi:MAG: hypothetical protein ACOCWL_00460, partial [Thermoguttaceae bacterium]